MTMHEFAGYGVLFAMAIVVGLIVFLLVWGPMRRLLGANDRLQQARAFFVRTLFIVLLLAAMAPVAGKGVTLDEDARFMQYVLQAAGRLNDVLLYVGLYLFGFVVLMTILTASLGRYRGE